MFDVSLLQGLPIVWAVVTGIMVVLLIYRGTLGAHEEGQLYLSQGDNMREREQQEVLKNEGKPGPFLYVFGFGRDC